MEQVVMLAKLSLCVLLLLSFWHGAHGARMLSARVQGELPPCKDIPGGIPGWDCFDPPTHDLPPCDFKHQRVGIDCWPKGPPAAKVSTPVTGISYSAAGGASTHDAHINAVTQSGDLHVQGELPPCKDVPGGIPNWDCYDPPLTPLPPCNFKHQNPGIDCSTDSQKPRPPPAPKAKAVTHISAASTDDAQIIAATQSGDHHVQGPLPPCKDVPGGISNWDCYGPPLTPLPPCDFKHQNPGIDCSTDSQKPRPPPAPKAKAVTHISAPGGGCVGSDCAWLREPRPGALP